MNVLSLFDGMSCGRLALERAGVTVTKYYRSEIDKWATKVALANYPDSICLGDITNWQEWDIDWGSIDLVLAGSPCQGFSFAGKHLNFEDERSKLFFEAVRILHRVRVENPDVKFMFENVKMHNDHLEVMSKCLGVQPVFIDSKAVSGANRKRYYWANFHIRPICRRDVSFQDCLDSGEALIEKAPALTATYYKKGGEATRQRNFQKSQRPIAWMDDATYTRWLTPTECERLMTVPVGYTAHVSDTQRYKMLGNGWTIDVAAHIFGGLDD